MRPQRTHQSGDSYERYISSTSRRAQDSYEKYLEQKRAEARKEKEQTIYIRSLPERQRKKRRLLFLALMVAVMVVISSVSFIIHAVNESRAYDRYMEAAQICTLGGDYDNALAYLRKAAVIDMSDECLLMMAQCYEAQENFDRAIEALRYMTSNDTAINNKIASIEQKKKNKAEEGNVSVAGKVMKNTETSLVLDNRGLGNGVVQEVTQLYALSNLSIAGNGISDISPLSTLGGLTTLNLSNNSISDISALGYLTGLRTLYLDNNPVGDLSVLQNIPSLTTLSLKGIDVTESQLKNLSNALPNCAINGANAKEETQIVALGGVTFYADVTSLDLSGKGIVDISALSMCKALTSVNLSGNYISDITPLMDIPGLQILNIAGNSVSDLRPLMGISSLRYLDASSNYINSTVSLGSNTGLTDLNLSYNSINNFTGLSKLKNLTNLNLAGTGFGDAHTDICTYMSKLIYLNVENNDNFTGEGFDRLRQLIPACNIAHSQLVYPVPADRFTISSNTSELDMNNSGVSDLSFLMQLNDLQSVKLANNRISNIYYFQFTESWRTITYLDLSNNQISDIAAVSNLRNLVTLNLTDNNIYDVTPLYTLSQLRELYIGGNPLTDEQVRELNAYLPNCYIYFR